MNGQNDLLADNARRTPTYILDRVKTLMGGIDLDPASDYWAQRDVRACQYFGAEPGPYGWGFAGRDGLAQTWSGSVWLNPPGGKLDPQTLRPIRGGPGISSAAVWWTKLVCEYQAGRVSQACFLAFSLNVFRCGQTGAPAPYMFPFLVFKDRIRFPASAGAKTESPNVDSALVYLPPRGTEEIVLTAKNRFATIFPDLGQVRL